RRSRASACRSARADTRRGSSSPPRPARSFRRWSARSRQHSEIVHGRRDGARRRLPEAADGCVLHHLREIGEDRALVPVRLAGRESVQRLFLTYGADAARDALPAGLVAEELGDAQNGADEIRLLAEHDDDAGAERHARLARALERERNVELIGAQERACGAAEQHRLRGLGAGELEERAQRRAELDLVQARAGDVAGETEEPRVARVVAEHDVGHVHERLDVVHDRRLAEEADLYREWGLVARLAAVSLDGLEERGLLAADVGARADAQLDVEAARVDRVLDTLVCERIFGPDVDEALLAA